MRTHVLSSRLSWWVMLLLVGGGGVDRLAGGTEEGVVRSVETISLWPPRKDGANDPENERVLKSMQRGLRYGNWLLQVRGISQPTDGVFWEIHARPLEIHPDESWSTNEIDYEAYSKQVPVIRTPEHLWHRWTSEEMNDVVGIHFHDLQRTDSAHVLYTQYAHRSDGADQDQGSRIEGTLLLPMTWWLDQTIVVREDMNKAKARSRVEHEVGHAANALRDLVETIRGEQDWNPVQSTGRRSKIVWRWRTEAVARPWDELFDGKRLVMTLRTYIDVLPPTRWSKLFDKPVDQLTQHDTLSFDDDHILIETKYAAYRQRSAAAYHHKVGGTESPTERAPNFVPGRQR